MIASILFSCLVAAPQEPAALQIAEQCGLGAEFHASRRAALREALGSGVLVLRGLPAPRDYTAFYQDKKFWYLTGVESPDVSFVMDLDSGREVLFLPKADPHHEIWNGKRWDTGDPWVSSLSGIEEVRPSTELIDVLGELLEDEDRELWYDGQPSIALAAANDLATSYLRNRRKDKLDGRQTREEVLADKLKEHFGRKPKDIEDELNRLRWIKTGPEVDAMRRSSEIGAAALVEGIRSSSAGLGEWELDAAMTFVHGRMGATGPAYNAICGSGPNSLILHYMESSRVMQAGEVILVDYGCEFEHYTTDITRSWPIDGQWTPRMVELYDVVLEAQLAGIAAVRPGATLRDIEAACDAVLKERGLSKFKRHGACHWIGMEVHDPGLANGYGSREPLVPGVCFTVEPGLYEEEAHIGIRIEDTVMVTAEGCEVLSKDAPKDRAALTKLVAEKGLLD